MNYRCARDLPAGPKQQLVLKRVERSFQILPLVCIALEPYFAGPQRELGYVNFGPFEFFGTVKPVHIQIIVLHYCFFYNMSNRHYMIGYFTPGSRNRAT